MPPFISLNISPTASRWDREQHPTAAGARVVRPPVEIADGAVLVSRADGAAELHGGCQEATGYGDLPHQDAAAEVDCP